MSEPVSNIVALCDGERVFALTSRLPDGRVAYELVNGGPQPALHPATSRIQAPDLEEPLIRHHAFADLILGRADGWSPARRAAAKK